MYDLATQSPQEAKEMVSVALDGWNFRCHTFVGVEV